MLFRLIDRRLQNTGHSLRTEDWTIPQPPPLSQQSTFALLSSAPLKDYTQTILHLEGILNWMRGLQQKVIISNEDSHSLFINVDFIQREYTLFNNVFFFFTMSRKFIIYFIKTKFLRKTDFSTALSMSTNSGMRFETKYFNSKCKDLDILFLRFFFWKKVEFFKNQPR